MTGEQYFEDYVEGEQRTTSGRTITEADIVIHAGQTGDFYPHHMDASGARRNPSVNVLPTAHWCSALRWG